MLILIKVLTWAASPIGFLIWGGLLGLLLVAIGWRKTGRTLLTVSLVQVVVLAGSRSQPVSLDQARPAIEQYLMNERRRKLADEDLKAMRAAARIAYRGQFAAAAASAAGAIPAER